VVGLPFEHRAYLEKLSGLENLSGLESLSGLSHSLVAGGAFEQRQWRQLARGYGVCTSGFPLSPDGRLWPAGCGR